MPLYVVETIQTFRHRYVIECNELEHAYDTVTSDEVQEFSQMYLGESIISGREISREEFDRMNKALESCGDGTHYQPESGSPWQGEQVINRVQYNNKRLNV